MTPSWGSKDDRGFGCASTVRSPNMESVAVLRERACTWRWCQKTSTRRRLRRERRRKQQHRCSLRAAKQPDPSDEPSGAGHCGWNHGKQKNRCRSARQFTSRCAAECGSVLCVRAEILPARARVRDRLVDPQRQGEKGQSEGGNRKRERENNLCMYLCEKLHCELVDR